MNLYVSVSEETARILGENDKTPIRTRGPLPTLTRQVVGDAATLSDLVSQSRLRVGNLPLTFVILGWGTAASVNFYSELEPLLNDRDGLWLTSLSEWQDLNEPARRGLIINLANKNDERLYMNLGADLVFFAEGGGLDVAQAVNAWRHRAGSVIVDAVHSSHCQRAVNHFIDFDRVVYKRYENGELEIQKFRNEEW